MRRTLIGMTLTALTLTAACSSSSGSTTSSTGSGAGSPTSSSGQSGTGGAGAGTGGQGVVGSSTTTSSSGSGGLACDAVGLCTTSEPAGPDPANPPAFTGGVIPDGLFRIEEGRSLLDAPDIGFLFQGSSFLAIGAMWSNSLGTWSTSGSTLSLTYKTTCDSNGPGASSQDPSSYEFVLQGSDLYLRDSSANVSRLHVVDPGGVCADDGAFGCHVTNCSCDSQQNMSLTGLDCTFN